MNRHRHPVGILIALTTLLVASSAGLAAAQGIFARPDSEAVAKAKRDVTELYGERIAKAKKPRDKIALGVHLLKTAGEPGNDLAAQSVLFYTARDLGVEAKDWALTSAAIGAIVDRFHPGGPTEPADQIRHGDMFRDAAALETAKEKRLGLQLDAAEWYTRAARGKGLQSQIAAKRLTEIAEALGCRSNVNDLKILIGTWEVTATNGYHARWTFLSNGTVRSTSGADRGKWTAEAAAIRISWSEKAWETFHRPLNINGTNGDSWHGVGILKAKKVAG